MMLCAKYKYMCGVEFTFTSFYTYFNYNSLQNMTVTAINLHCFATTVGGWEIRFLTNDG